MLKHLGRRSVVLAAGMMALLGCGGSALDLVPIRGEVIYNGKPLTDGTVVYLPATGSAGRQATGPILPDGTFSLTTLQRDDGVMKGSYQIVVYAYKPHPGEPKSREEHEAMVKKGGIERGFVIPERYTDPATSQLSDTVDENHSGFKKIELVD